MINDANGKPLFLSPSMLATAGKCQMQVRWFYVERLRKPPAFATALGHAYHDSVLKTDQAGRLATGEYTPLEHLRDGLTGVLQKEFPEIPETDDAVGLYGSKESAYSHFEKAGLALLDAYDTDRGRYNGRGFEVPFQIDFAGYAIKGYFDIDVTDTLFKDAKTRDLSPKPDSRGAMRAGKKKTQGWLDEDLQFAAYAAVKAKITGIPGQRIDAIFSYVKKDEGEIETMSTIRLANSHEATEEYAHRLYRAIEADTLLPVDKSGQSGWVCSAKFCGAWESICPFGRRASVSVAVSR